ncbi:hypothetical protein [Leptospira harrisiae]|uniref:hypothetical protein n=1 Tax=Leptospira harrisiae TaxID=2023189 RepID=UPI000F643BE6|nr:hypothetical protein [Leptospira harrisiae]
MIRYKKFKGKGFIDDSVFWVETGENINQEGSEVMKVLESDSIQEIAKNSLDSEVTAGFIGN